MKLLFCEELDWTGCSLGITRSLCFGLGPILCNESDEVNLALEEIPQCLFSFQQQFKRKFHCR